MNKKAMEKQYMVAILILVILLLVVFPLFLKNSALGQEIAKLFHPDNVYGENATRDKTITELNLAIQDCYDAGKEEQSEFYYCPEKKFPLTELSIDQLSQRFVKASIFDKGNCIRMGYSEQLGGVVLTGCDKDLEKDFEELFKSELSHTIPICVSLSKITTNCKCGNLLAGPSFTAEGYCYKDKSGQSRFFECKDINPTHCESYCKDYDGDPGCEQTEDYDEFQICGQDPCGYSQSGCVATEAGCHEWIG